MYFGDGLYGVEAASRGYFGKKASELSLPEAALLAGLLKAPSSYAPTVSAEKAEARQGVVLKAMLENKAITRDQYDRAITSHRRDLRRPARGGTLRTVLQGRSAAAAGRAIRRGARGDGGLRVYTTIDLAMQQAADAAVEQGLQDIEKTLPKRSTRHAAPRGRLAQASRCRPRSSRSIRTNGHVLAMVGGRDFVKSSFNRATLAKRQPGSAFKPFIYAAAVEGGLGPEDCDRRTR